MSERQLRQLQGKDSCNSDSGGPLIVTKNNKGILVGVVSWGRDHCVVKCQPGVYARVAQAYDHITKATCSNLSLLRSASRPSRTLLLIV